MAGESGACFARRGYFIPDDSAERSAGKTGEDSAIAEQVGAGFPGSLMTCSVAESQVAISALQMTVGARIFPWGVGTLGNDDD